MAVAADALRTLPEVLGRQAALRPAHVALRCDGEAITHAELAARIERAAGVLARDWQVRAGDRVAWLGLNHPAQLVLLFALARLGAALLPMNVRLAPAEWDALLRSVQPRHLVHDAAFAQAARDACGRGILAAHPAETLDEAGPAVDGHDASPDAPALLVQTSGTTGGPRVAVHTQAQLAANIGIAWQVQAITPDDRVLTVLPLFHVGGLCIQTLPALASGATVLLHARFTPEATFEALAAHRPTLTLQVPATMKALVDHPQWTRADLSCLRAVWAGSSLLPAPLLETFHARGVPVCNVYGATETGPFSIALGPGHAMDHVGSCGWPAPGVEVRLQRQAGHRDGEVCLRGPNVVRHYWPGVPAVDAQGWFHTGDLAAQAADGSYTIVGRARDLVISGGENIHPAEIEAALALHPAVLECAAFGVPDPRWGEALAVALVLREGASASDEALRDHLAARLARFKLPRHWLRVPALPKTALGKVQRSCLPTLCQRG